MLSNASPLAFEMSVMDSRSRINSGDGFSLESNMRLTSYKYLVLVQVQVLEYYRYNCSSCLALQLGQLPPSESVPTVFIGVQVRVQRTTWQSRLQVQVPVLVPVS